MSNDLTRLASRLESLLDQIEPLLGRVDQLLPAPGQPDWKSAIAFRWRRRRTPLGSAAMRVPVARPAALRLDDLQNIDEQKRLVEQGFEPAGQAGEVVRHRQVVRCRSWARPER